MKRTRKLLCIVMALAFLLTLMPTLGGQAYAAVFPVATIGETEYASLAAAVEAAASGDTITLVSDDGVSLTNGQEISISKDLTIVGGGFTVYGTGTNNGYNDTFLSAARATSRSKT